MWSERKHGLSTEQFPVSAYVGSSKNLKDLKRGLESESDQACTRRDTLSRAERETSLLTTYWSESTVSSIRF